MYLYRIEVDGDVNDYADCFFRVIASSRREALEKARELDGRRILSVVQLMYLGGN